ncbi:hypothetical protein V1509DRAFT_47973 [Lipomyces kononenkoae]
MKLLPSTVSQTSVSPAEMLEAYRNMTPLQHRLENDPQWQNQQQRLDPGYQTGTPAQSRLQAQKSSWMNQLVDDPEFELRSTMMPGSRSPSKRVTKYQDVPKLRLTTASGHTTNPSHDSSALAAFDNKFAENDAGPNLKKKPSSWKLMFSRKTRDPEQPEIPISPQFTSSPNEYQLQRTSVGSISPRKTVGPALSFQDMPYQKENLALRVGRFCRLYFVFAIIGGSHAKEHGSNYGRLDEFSPK